MSFPYRYTSYALSSYWLWMMQRVCVQATTFPTRKWCRMALLRPLCMYSVSTIWLKIRTARSRTTLPKIGWYWTKIPLLLRARLKSVVRFAWQMLIKVDCYINIEIGFTRRFHLAGKIWLDFYGGIMALKSTYSEGGEMSCVSSRPLRCYPIYRDAVRATQKQREHLRRRWRENYGRSLTPIHL